VKRSGESEVSKRHLGVFPTRDLVGRVGRGRGGGNKKREREKRERRERKGMLTLWELLLEFFTEEKFTGGVEEGKGAEEYEEVPI